MAAILKIDFRVCLLKKGVAIAKLHPNCSIMQTNV